MKNLNLKKSLALTTLMLFALVAWACGPAATNNTRNGNTNGGADVNKGVEKLVACDDAQVIKDMIATIDAKYPLLKSRMTHLNAYSKGCSVILTGYTDTLQNFKDFYNVASGTPNVVAVNIDNLFIEKSEAPIKDPDGQCPVGQQACGDICVPPGQCWKEQKMDANSNTNSNTNVNSGNSKSNSNAAAKP
ncbi:MAG: hypothetical protein WBD16_07655 [Pyrinomonadaceae bacterium]